MGYHGVVSKGCERCRQRKVKCDQRKPRCLKCERIGEQCPGYRNLAKVMFRDESERIVRKCSKPERTEVSCITPVSNEQDSGEITVTPQRLHSPLCASTPHQPLNNSLQDLSVNFFAKKFGFEGPKFYTPRCWFMESYAEIPTNHALRAAVEAIGLAGLSNVYYAPQLAIEAKKQHCRALAGLNGVLSDPARATEDTTLMTIHLLSLFETVNFENWEQYSSWATHIRAVTVLFNLRGMEQFARERGAQLYVRMRQSVLAACLHEGLPVPPALVDLSYAFQTSDTRQRWRLRHVATPGSMFEIALRIVNLKAAVHQGDLKEPQVICSKALDIDHDLESWAACMDPGWNYGTTSTSLSDHLVNDTRFIYPSRWVAEAWNSWRAMRILVSQTILRAVDPTVDAAEEIKSAAIGAIRRFSQDLCISVSSFDDSPALISMIEPLYCVACEKQNDELVRTFAISQLRHISATMGIRQAALFADSVPEQHSYLA